MEQGKNPGGPPPREELTGREMQIARAYADGGSYRAVAEVFGISPATVRTHIGTVYRKLGVGSKIELLRAIGPSARDGRDVTEHEADRLKRENRQLREEREALRMATEIFARRRS